MDPAVPRGLTCLLAWVSGCTLICDSKGSPQAQSQGRMQKQMTEKIVRKSGIETQSPSRLEKLTPSQTPRAVWMLHIWNWMLGEVLIPGHSSAPHPPASCKAQLVWVCCLTAARTSSELPIVSQESMCGICHCLVNAV